MLKKLLTISLITLLLTACDNHKHTKFVKEEVFKNGNIAAQGDDGYWYWYYYSTTMNQNNFNGSPPTSYSAPKTPGTWVKGNPPDKEDEEQVEEEVPNPQEEINEEGEPETSAPSESTGESSSSSDGGGE